MQIASSQPMKVAGREWEAYDVNEMIDRGLIEQQPGCALSMSMEREGDAASAKDNPPMTDSSKEATDRQPQ
jgi:hypothetical protein